MPFFIISILMQVCLVVHIVKTGRNTTWIWIVVMLPLAGALAYLIVEVLPDMFGSHGGRAATRIIQQKLNPNKSLKAAAQNYAIADTVQNSAQLAQEMLGKGMFVEAGKLYENCLKGVHEDDPYLMHGLAQALFGQNKFQAVKSLLDELIQKNPDFKNADAHLLYARTLEALGEQGALEEYQVLHGYYPGPEASYRLAVFLRQLGRIDEANLILQEIMKKALYAGKHYIRQHRVWIKKTKAEIASRPRQSSSEQEI
ncbi:tetratricopeptide repeat protein [Corallincola spongiicola]|uniref:Cardiolipin synthase N-terminal domain-containing protein n=1 Tax=Corallincola spongiicola TaxID=2520508 RepID=A0ABY1WT98_9GAMM|nr:tetratricopeptide repeat protein [Corallincola spongiicola]TAA47858.1 hypothetical protein EXY25_01005 [Corallincola spongiicola]